MMSQITGFGQANPPPMNQLVHSSAIARDASGKIVAHVKILEQPAENKLRFSYECECGVDGQVSDEFVHNVCLRVRDLFGRFPSPGLFCPKGSWSTDRCPNPEMY